MLNQFQELGINNPLKLRSLMMSNIGGGLFGKDQRFSDMDGNIIDPDTISEGPNGIFGMNEDGKMVEVRRTREGAIDQMKDTFGEDIMKRLKKHYPDIGYTALGGYMPGSSGELETLGKKAALKKNQDGSYTTPDGRLISKEQGEKYNKMIFDAREATRDRDGSGGQSGIMTTVPPPPPPPPDDPMIPVDPDPYFPVDPTLPVPPKYPSSVITDYTQLGLPNIYGNQQIPTYDYANFNQTGQPVGLQDYLENLRQRFGIG